MKFTQEMLALAERKNLLCVSGCKSQIIAAFIHLDGEKGAVKAVHRLPPKTKVLVPDLGTKAVTGIGTIITGSRANVLKRENPDKANHFLETMADGAKTIPAMAACMKFLNNKAAVDAANNELEQLKIKPESQIAFTVDGTYLMDIPEVMEWWATYKSRYSSDKQLRPSVCLVTGKQIVPTKNHAVLKEFGHAIGGSDTGTRFMSTTDSMPCFESYGRYQGENAPISPEASLKITAAMDYLGERAPVIAGRKYLFWYNTDELREEEDILSLLTLHYTFGGSLENNDELATSQDAEEPKKAKKRLTKAEQAAEERRRIAEVNEEKARKVVTQLFSGQVSKAAEDAKYRIAVIARVRD